MDPDRLFHKILRYSTILQGKEEQGHSWMTFNGTHGSDGDDGDNL
jgi:hypothetical protein